MALKSKPPSCDDIERELINCSAMSPEILRRLVGCACVRLPKSVGTKDPSLFWRLINFGAWTDGAMLLIHLEMPPWRLRRLVQEEGQWLCSLSREPFLPMEIDETVQGRHENEAVALFLAFLHLRQNPPEPKEDQCPQPSDPQSKGTSMCCDNFR